MMFSLNKDSGGYRLFVTRADGSRASLRLLSLGIHGRREAEELRRTLHALVAMRCAAVPLDDAIQAQIGSFSPRLRSFLEDTEFLPRTVRQPTLHEYMATFTKRKAVAVKVSTMRVFGRTIQRGMEFFTPEETLATVTADRAVEFRKWLSQTSGRRRRPLAEATIRKTCAIMSEVFTAATREGLIRENPFLVARIKKCVQPNRSREYFVTREETARLLASCMDSEERLMVGLARFAGLRMPSEIVSLRWTDFDLGARTLIIRSPKTAHHSNGGIRKVPVFPIVFRLLQEKLADSPDSEYLLPALRLHPSLSTRMRRVIRESGITDYPRAMHNLRLSCISEWVLADRRDLVTVAEWAGHSIQVMTAHYLKQINADSASKAALEAAAPSGAGVVQTWENPLGISARHAEK
jgi:integrase